MESRARRRWIESQANTGTSVAWITSADRDREREMNDRRRAAILHHRDVSDFHRIDATRIQHKTNEEGEPRTSSRKKGRMKQACTGVYVLYI